MVRAVGAVLADVDESEQEAAKVLGANGVQVFTRIILPAIKGGLLSGCVFTFARSLGEFGATILVASNLALKTETARLFIFSEFDRGNAAAANSTAVLLVIISLVLFFGFKLVNKILERKGTSNGERGIPQES